MKSSAGVIKYSSGGRFEKLGAYSRALRVGPFVYIAGTTAIEPSGLLHAPNDMHAQTLYIFKRIDEALSQVGAGLQHVVRTRAFLTDITKAGEFARAHGEVFEGIDPVSSGVEAGLTLPGMMIEIEVDALVHDGNGNIDYG